MIVIDTDILSELMQPKPSPRVLKWIAEYEATRLFITTVTQAEILYGIQLLAFGKRRTGLKAAAEAMFDEDFAGRILAFESDSAYAFADTAAARRAAGNPVSQFDAQIAAIARSHTAAVATRNTAHFEGCGIQVLNP